MTSRVGVRLQGSLADTSIAWAHPWEPSLLIGRSTPLAVGVSADGRGVVETMALSAEEDHLLGLGDRGLTPPSPPTSPPASTGFSLAYSRYLGSLFRVGGDDPATRAPLGTIWRADAEGSSWTLLPTKVPVGTPLASAVSFADRALYVIDEITDTGGLVARLLRFDAATGGGEVVRSWPRAGDFDKLWLELDLDGNLLLVGSSTTRNEHRIVRIGVRDGVPVASLLYSHSDTLAWPLVVDAAGVTLFQRAVGSAPVAVVQHHPGLKDLGGGWGAVGALL